MYGLKSASIAFLATIVTAQGLPSCAQSCVTNYNGCSQFDVACICGSTQWIQGLSCCVSKQCGADDQQATINYANTICAGVGITNLPQSATCASGASSYSTGAATISVASSLLTQGTASITSASTVSSGSVSLTSGTTAQSMTSVASAAATTSSTTTRSGAASIQTAAIGLGALLAGLVAVV